MCQLPQKTCATKSCRILRPVHENDPPIQIVECDHNNKLGHIVVRVKESCEDWWCAKHAGKHERAEAKKAKGQPHSNDAKEARRKHKEQMRKEKALAEEESREWKAKREKHVKDMEKFGNRDTKARMEELKRIDEERQERAKEVRKLKTKKDPFADLLNDVQT